MSEEKCICPDFACCTLCSMFSCDCDPQAHKQLYALKEKCQAHPKPTYADYRKAVVIKIAHERGEDKR